MARYTATLETPRKRRDVAAYLSDFSTTQTGTNAPPRRPCGSSTATPDEETDALGHQPPVSRLRQVTGTTSSGLTAAGATEAVAGPNLQVSLATLLPLAPRRRLSSGSCDHAPLGAIG